jgi:hypothetical protein
MVQHLNPIFIPFFLSDSLDRQNFVRGILAKSMMTLSAIF